MTKQEFINSIVKHGINPNTISFNDGLKEGYGIRKVYWRWEIYYRERGKEYDVRGYPSESDALINLLEELVKHRT